MRALLLAGTTLLALSAPAAIAVAAPITFAYTGGFQSFIVPTAGTYDILADGAQGGAGGNSASGTTSGGLGAEAGGVFALAAGEVLRVAVGGHGGDGSFVPARSVDAGGGGGGGSFVVGPGDTPLVVAGGGGGGGGYGSSRGGAGQIGTAGGSGGGDTYAPGAAGGTDGSGGGGVSTAGGGGGGFNGADTHRRRSFFGQAASTSHGGHDCVQARRQGASRATELALRLLHCHTSILPLSSVPSMIHIAASYKSGSGTALIHMFT